MKLNYILMLEKDAEDRELMQNHINSSGLNIICEFVHRSNEVIKFLSEKMLKRESLPGLILLSMNSIPDNALVVLKQLKQNKLINHIPVVILGENTNPEMIRECYSNGANSFINKPLTNELTVFKIDTFLKYWCDVAEGTGSVFVKNDF